MSDEVKVTDGDTKTATTLHRVGQSSERKQANS